MIAAVLLSSAVAMGVVTAASDAVGMAREFLNLVVSDPTETTPLMTTDAVMVVGDIGGPFAQFVAKAHPKAGWMGACSIGQLKPSPEKSSELSNDKDPPPWLKGGNLTVIEGTLSCTRPQGQKADLQAIVILKDQKVAMFGLNRKR